jgi:hypothetical protein
MVIGLVAAFVVPFLLSTPPLSDPEDQLEFPIVYVPPLPGDPELPGDIRIQLNEDGSASVAETPLGTVRISDGYICVASEDGLATGQGTWAPYKPGWLLVDVGGQQTAIGARGRFGDLDWARVAFRDCSTGVQTWLFPEG